MHEIAAESGGAKKLSYIKQTQAEPGAVDLDAKSSTLHNLRFGSHIGAGTTGPKCNAQLRQCRLSPTDSTNSIFNFLIFLSKSYKSLHADQPYFAENETGVRRCLTSTPYNSIRCVSIFLQNCLISSHGWTADRRFFTKRGLLSAMVAQIRGCLIFQRR